MFHHSADLPLHDSYLFSVGPPLFLFRPPALFLLLAASLHLLDASLLLLLTPALFALLLPPHLTLTPLLLRVDVEAKLTATVITVSGANSGPEVRVVCLSYTNVEDSTSFKSTGWILGRV